MAALTLAACGGTKPAAGAQAQSHSPLPADSLPLTDATSVAPLVIPATGSTPGTEPIRVVHLKDKTETWAYIDKAAAMRDALGDAPPDYAFTYGGVQVWVWRSADNATLLVEPAAGGARSYFFRTGTVLPFLVSNGINGYGYDNDSLAVVYGGDQRPLPSPQLDQQSALAAQYLQRGQTLYVASLESPRETAAGDRWTAGRPVLAAEQALWVRQAAKDPDWRAFHDRNAKSETIRWAPERQLRKALADARLRAAATQAAADRAEAQTLAEIREVVAENQAATRAKKQAAEAAAAAARDQGQQQARLQARAAAQTEARAQNLLGSRGRHEAENQALWEAEAKAHAQQADGPHP